MMETVMSVKDKLILSGVATAVILAGFASYHFWAYAVEVLQRLVATALVDTL
jgi:hypothetical protein